MAVPKCKECDNHHYNNFIKTIINISANRMYAHKTDNRAHFCKNKLSFTHEFQSKRWIPTTEMGSSSPKWCPLRKAGEANAT